jgi:hypothetical protein
MWTMILLSTHLFIFNMPFRIATVALGLIGTVVMIFIKTGKKKKTAKKNA